MKAFPPPRGKLSPKVTDEGRRCLDCPLKGCQGAFAPHPALRATFPLGGRLQSSGKASAEISTDPSSAAASALALAAVIRPVTSPDGFCSRYAPTAFAL